LSLSPALKTRGVDFVLVSKDELVLYSSNFPSSLAVDGRKAQVFTGFNPPLPLMYTFTLPGYLYPAADIDLFGSDLSAEPKISGNMKIVRTELHIRDRIELKNDG
jgi:hypothetical protein